MLFRWMSSNVAKKIVSDLGTGTLKEATRTETSVYFIVTVLGFSFWFLMAVPFASHRESYSWLAMVHSQGFAHIFAITATTFRPLAQSATWLGFLILNPGVFPTSIARQAVLQGLVYVMFIIGWWMIYSSAPQRRLFSAVAFVAGSVFFSGYVHLFHIYGVFYVPVILTLGALLRLHASGRFYEREVTLAAAAVLLILWHPFATALFLGFYLGFYLVTFGQRCRIGRLRGIVILLLGSMAVVAVLIPSPRTTSLDLGTRLFGSLVSYQTNETNLTASFVAFGLTQMVICSLSLAARPKVMSVIGVCVLSGLMLFNGIPLVMLWVSASVVKLFWLRSWSLLCLAMAAAALPFGGGIGTPIYGLFAIIVAAYVTSLRWYRVERMLSRVRIRYVIGFVAALLYLVVLVRAGIRVPILSGAARPLLSERERTFQLEGILAWLRVSRYCGYGITFPEDAGSPIDSVQSALRRRNRPPAGLRDVQSFWSVLKCEQSSGFSKTHSTAIVTFGSASIAASIPVFRVKGRYSGDATVWVEGDR